MNKYKEENFYSDKIKLYSIDLLIYVLKDTKYNQINLFLLVSLNKHPKCN